MGFWIKVVKKEPRAKRVSTAYPFYPFTRFMHRLLSSLDYHEEGTFSISIGFAFNDGSILSVNYIIYGQK